MDFIREIDCKLAAGLAWCHLVRHCNNQMILMAAKTLSFYISPAIVCVQCIKLLPLLLSSNIKGQPAEIRS